MKEKPPVYTLQALIKKGCAGGLHKKGNGNASSTAGQTQGWTNSWVESITVDPTHTNYRSHTAPQGSADPDRQRNIGSACFLPEQFHGNAHELLSTANWHFQSIINDSAREGSSLVPHDFYLRPAATKHIYDTEAHWLSEPLIVLRSASPPISMQQGKQIAQVLSQFFDKQITASLDTEGHVDICYLQNISLADMLLLKNADLMEANELIRQSRSAERGQNQGMGRT